MNTIERENSVPKLRILRETGCEHGEEKHQIMIIFILKASRVGSAINEVAR